MDKLPAQMTVVAISKPGGPEVLVPEQRSVPQPGPDEILVKIELPRLRSRVDRRLKTMLREDDLGLLHEGPPVMEIAGTRAQRVAIALADR